MFEGFEEVRRRILRMAATGLEFKNVVFNAARDGKLRRLKVGNKISSLIRTVIRDCCSLGEDDLDDLYS